MRAVILSERPRPWAETHEVVSAGAVVFRDRKALLLKRTDEFIWCLPKGKVEEGETLEDAALREVREESGLDCTILERINEVAYTYYWPPDEVNYDKRVVYFLASSPDGDVLLEDAFDDSAWCFERRALELLYYENDRRVVRKAFVEAARLLQ